MAPPGSVAIALPGFGIAMRSAAGEPFSYVCDALLGVAPSEAAPALSFAADGALLVGSASGLRSVGANGCPRADFGGELQRQPLARLAVHPRDPSVVYAVTNATLPRLFRSSDGGATWEQRASLVAINPITALVLDPSAPDTVYVSQSTPGGGALLHASTDGGATVAAITQKPGLTLLDVEPAGEDAGAARFWAVGRSATAMGIQGFSLFGAASPSGPWTPVHDVRFFGGFARDPGGALWLGDEAGGVFRSTDGGGSFTNVSATTAVSCLDFSQGALWGCTPGLAEQTTLVTWNDAREAFDGVVALASVERMPDCAPATDVATQCAAAWLEWRRDILLLPPAPVDAGSRPNGTGGNPAIPPPSDAGEPTNPQSPDASSPAGAPVSSSGCAIRRQRFPCSSVVVLVLAALCLVSRRSR